MDKLHAKPFVTVLTSKINLKDEIVGFLEEALGRVDLVGPWHVFEHTKYYEPEMGTGLKRCLVSFEKAISMDELPRLKSLTLRLEEKYRAHGSRAVNVDPGYVDLHKVVLASGKGGGHMIALTQSVFLDFLLWYNKGWQPLPWTYPDFRDGGYFKELEEMRSMLKKSEAGRA
jgi:hypothetical protein